MLPADNCKSFPTEPLQNWLLKTPRDLFMDAETGTNIPLQMDRWKKIQITFQIEVIH